MEYLESLFIMLTRLRWTDLLDIAVVAFLIYRLLPMFRSSGAVRIAQTVGTLLLLSWITDLLDMYALNYLLDQVLQVGFLAIVILFQPELRRMIDHLLSNVKLAGFFGLEKPTQETELVIGQVVRACESMSRDRVGALIVFGRDSALDEYIRSGTEIQGQVSEQLIRNIFFPKAALHDGAMIIREGKIAAAGCVLPLSASHAISADLGTRHRAGVGMSEASDAVVVIVSEETGIISVAVGGVLKRYLAPQMLERMLRNELCKEPKEASNDLMDKVKRMVQKQSDRKEGGSDREK